MLQRLNQRRKRHDLTCTTQQERTGARVCVHGSRCLWILPVLTLQTFPCASVAFSPPRKSIFHAYLSLSLDDDDDDGFDCSPPPCLLLRSCPPSLVSARQLRTSLTALAGLKERLLDHPVTLLSDGRNTATLCMHGSWCRQCSINRSVSHTIRSLSPCPTNNSPLSLCVSKLLVSSLASKRFFGRNRGKKEDTNGFHLF